MSIERKTSQYILPVVKPEITGYDPYPVHELASGSVQVGYESLAKAIAGEQCVIIDGYVGIDFEDFAQKLNSVLIQQGVKACWWNVEAALRDESEINSLIEPFLGGDDPIFGYRTTLDIKDFFSAEKLRAIKPEPKAALNIFYGIGASLATVEGKLIYIDIPKNEIQFRSRAACVTNLGAKSADTPKKMYKRFYFVDWVVLNRHKKAILPKIDIIVDGQRPEEITWMSGESLRNGLTKLSQGCMRVRPWFEPGAWGGQWIREHIKALPHNVPNYAWSFELIVPENGLIFSSEGKMLEVSFDMVMFHGGADVVGKECYAEYADEFPIRMDYLDNFDGGNLSIQCHPQREFIQKNFGEVLTQEETYYILDTDKDACVYLGFKEDIVPEKFEAALTESFKQGTPLDVPRYINAEKAHKHDLFLIPPGTLHSSGRNNLVLEISTTPYIFTFKMYDWLALDLDGNPRPLNISRAMQNLCFDRKGEVVKRDLVCHPKLIEKGSDWELWHLPTHERHSYDVHRYVIGSEIEVHTEGKC
ncbi:MAG: class I mannose-6-phosphate isomerase, partial [Bacteroidales bacterium]|nr:class I mannose-6-phosphate isomerase [Bacteroidales bacterium]